MLEISPLRPEDRADWEVLARGYKEFYLTTVPDAGYEETWQQLLCAETLHGIAARLHGKVVGIAHYLFHGQVWAGEACYLQDLFVDEAARGQGVARALIDQVAQTARDRGATCYYWHTQQDNARARVLYDRVARFTGFISYEYPLS